MAESKSSRVPLYAVPIHHSIAGGDLAEMKKLAAEGDEYVKSHGDISSALEALKIEIAKHEAKGK